MKRVFFLFLLMLSTLPILQSLGKVTDKSVTKKPEALNAIRAEFSNYFKSQKFFSVKETEDRYGRIHFEAAQFRKGDFAMRAKMAADLVESKVLIGKSEIEVHEILGPPNAYFWDEHIPAYLIEDGRKPKHLEVMVVIFFENVKRKKRVERLMINWEDLKISAEGLPNEPSPSTKAGK